MKKTKFEGLTSRLGKECMHTLVEIAGPQTPHQVPKPDLDDEQKRWLIVGICLHTTISPILRTYVQPKLEKLYLSLLGSDNINTQVYPHYLKRYKPTNKELNYEAINNNDKIPKLKGGKKDVQKYDYKVINDVDFSKLFLVTNMTHYTGFDESCDMSALLGMICNIDTFPGVVKHVAEKVRSDVRNPWAHCDFLEWDVVKYQDSFQRMYQLLKNLQLPQQIEADAISNINKWQTNGIHLLQGTTIGLELLQTLKTETKSLGKYVLEVVAKTDECFVNISDTISGIENTIEKAVLAIDALTYDVNMVKSTQNDQKDEIKQLETDLENVRVDIAKTKHGHRETTQKVLSIEENIAGMESVIKSNKTKIDHIEKYMSSSRPSDKAYFYPPNRVGRFVAREDEMCQIEDLFLKEGKGYELIVVCGLGGTGKTSLAVEYAWKYQNFYSGGVFWMSAESNEALEDALQRLAIDINTVGESSKETLQKTLKWIASIQENWLLIIDNLDEDELYGNTKELVFGSWQRVPNANIIITSRRESTQAEVDFNVQATKCLTLDVLSEHESKQLLRSRCEMLEDNSDLDLLVGELGGLPLALEQAGAHIKVLKCTYSEYLETFLKKRIKFLRSSRSIFSNSKTRQAVYTTWQLNFEYVSKHSKDEDLGTTAVNVMEVAAFLYPDDIPIAILNSGLPAVPNEDMVECLSERLGPKQVLEVLTRFSLFQRSSEETFTVHRLVQEVIRENIPDDDRKEDVLMCATRMIHKALKSTKSPYDALKDENIGRTSLQLWSKLALHANTLRRYVFEFAMSNPLHGNLCINVETVNILQASAIYHSVFQRQDEALAAQEQILKLLAAINLPEDEYKMMMSIKIPLLSNYRMIIQSSIMTVVKEDNACKNALPLDPETLRIKGNEAFKDRKYHEAIQCYTEAITASKQSFDPRLFSNRSLAYLKLFEYENAAQDANKCIEIDPSCWKAYVWKAYAIAELMGIGQLPLYWESAGLAAAAAAGHFNIKCLLQLNMKIHYPIVRFKEIDNQHKLNEEVGSLYNMTYTTLLLKKGQYKIQPQRYPFTRSVQIIGIEDGVEVICIDECFPLCKPKKSWFSVDIIIEPQMNVYFENLFFPEDTPQIAVCKDVNATFYRCRFSNGKKGCEHFPNCDGKVGCVSKDPHKCSALYEQERTKGYRLSSGEVGFAGIVAESGGNVLIDKCILDRCGGGGALCDGEKANLIVKNSVITNMRQIGVESRNGGYTFVDKCTITKNQTHGVAVGPNGRGKITNCTIQGNGKEGIWCGVNTGLEKDSGSSCNILNNMIYQNGESGISMDGGSFYLYGNRIFENWLWGLYVKSRSTANLYSNDVFDNKCGGIRIGVNYSAPVVIDGNTIRDHSGPAIHFETGLKSAFPGLPLEMVQGLIQIDNEVNEYSIPPFITSRNIIRDNNQCRHPKKLLSQLKACCFCHTTSKKLMCCSKCKKAQYCSKGCQTGHWVRHKPFCILFKQNFIINIPLSKTKTVQEYYKLDHKPVNFPTGDLPGYGQGKMPDKRSKQKFVVKIQSGPDYAVCDPNTWMKLYDQSQKFEIMFQNSMVYHMVIECGVLAGTQQTTKKIFCWASFQDCGKTLCLYTDNLAPFQTW